MGYKKVHTLIYLDFYHQYFSPSYWRKQTVLLINGLFVLHILLLIHSNHMRRQRRYECVHSCMWHCVVNKYSWEELYLPCILLHWNDHRPKWNAKSLIMFHILEVKIFTLFIWGPRKENRWKYTREGAINPSHVVLSAYILYYSY